MAKIRPGDTIPELLARSILHRHGIRYSLKNAGLPGRPDIVLSRHRMVIFIHGCFWHRHRGCPKAAVPSTRAEFWKRKFEANVRRDAAVRTQLRKSGWDVFTIWECRLLLNPIKAMTPVIARLDPSGRRSPELPPVSELVRLAKSRQRTIRRRAVD